MARRRAPEPPPKDSQRKVFNRAPGVLPNGKPKPWGPIEVSPEPLSDLMLLDRWLLRDFPDAALIAPKKRGRPAEWDVKLAAVRWLIGHRETLSDAPESRCVKSLIAFLDDWRARPGPLGRKRGPGTPGTAAQLAGSLINIVRSAKPWPTS